MILPLAPFTFFIRTETLASAWEFGEGCGERAPEPLGKHPTKVTAGDNIRSLPQQHTGEESAPS